MLTECIPKREVLDLLVVPRGDVFSDILLLLKVIQHGRDIVTSYLLLTVLCKCRLFQGV